MTRSLTRKDRRSQAAARYGYDGGRPPGLAHDRERPAAGTEFRRAPSAGQKVRQKWVMKPQEARQSQPGTKKGTQAGKERGRLLPSRRPVNDGCQHAKDHAGDKG